MSTHNISSCGEIRKMSMFFLFVRKKKQKKKKHLELYVLPSMNPDKSVLFHWVVFDKCK